MFTPEEIKSAKATRDALMSGEYPPELKSIYMAGEIVMWDELKKKDESRPTIKSISVCDHDWEPNQFGGGRTCLKCSATN